MRTSIRQLIVGRLLAAALSLTGALAMISPSSTARMSNQSGVATSRFSQAEIFVELNDTDDDLGLHASIDGEPWTSLEVEGPNERTLLNLVSSGRLRSQGLTQLAFESAEPPFEDAKLSLDLPPTITRFEVPTSITSLGRISKFEIIARTITGNNTAIESCFLVR